MLQFAGAVAALAPNVGVTGAPEGRGGCCSVSHDGLGLGCMPLGLAEARGALAAGRGVWMGSGSFLQSWNGI